MSALRQIVGELLGLFVEDGSLALVLIALVAAAAILAKLAVTGALVGLLLLAGSLAALTENVLRARRLQRR
jgi:hypothetical protein